MPSMTGLRAAGARLRSMLSLATAVAASAVLASCTVQRLDERAIAPELALNTAHITEGTTRWRMTIQKDTATRELGVMTSSTQYADYMGRPAILFVRAVPTPKGDVVDSVLVLRHTLAPVWEHSHQPTKTMLLSFTDSAVIGEWAPADSTMRSVHHPVPRPVFNATAQGLLIGSLPLAEGYRTLIPIYSFELGGMELDTLSVVGTARVKMRSGGERDVWKLAFADPFITATFWVDRETRRVLLQDIVSRKTGVIFRQEPVL
ncbi:MAG TPA: hypothetical protein VIR34_00495 [Gemmatimonadaceae bacterium]|jgi:hypothetical protein